MEASLFVDLSGIFIIHKLFMNFRQEQSLKECDMALEEPGEQ